jgi:hypothetical protein
MGSGANVFIPKWPCVSWYFLKTMMLDVHQCGKHCEDLCKRRKGRPLARQGRQERGPSNIIVNTTLT